MSELAEGARLEIVCAVNSGTEGSNPSLSATTVSKKLTTVLNRHAFILTVTCVAEILDILKNGPQ